MEEIPPYARFVAIGMAAAAAVGLLINHFMPESQSAARLMLLCLGPMALLLGIGGSVEPKVIWSLGKFGQHLPLKYKIIGGSLAGVGVVLTLILVFVVYPVKMG
jgi:hypothetical protein